MTLANIHELMAEILSSLREKNWEKLGEKADELKQWAIAAKKAATELGNNEFPGDGEKQ